MKIKYFKGRPPRQTRIFLYKTDGKNLYFYNNTIWDLSAYGVCDLEKFILRKYLTKEELFLEML